MYRIFSTLSFSVSLIIYAEICFFRSSLFSESDTHILLRIILPQLSTPTDIRFVLEADEREVLTVSSASLYVTFVDTGDTDSIKINRAYRSIIANGQKVSAANGKVFVTCVFGGMPDDMLDGTVVHFTLGGNTYDKTISV